MHAKIFWDFGWNLLQKHKLWTVTKTDSPPQTYVIQQRNEAQTQRTDESGARDDMGKENSRKNSTQIVSSLLIFKHLPH